MPEKQIATFTPQNKEEWRAWLQQNHLKAESVWLIYFKKHTGLPTVSWSDTVDQALCFGWIDSLVRPIDEEKFMRLFTRRKPKSVWSAINKEKVAKLIESNLMMPAGLSATETAKSNGYWDKLNDVDNLLLPADLESALSQNEPARIFFHQMSNSAQRSLLQWLTMARKDQTRSKRIIEIVDCAAKQVRPKAVAWAKNE
jgi:uncharacterized protein YdeI (YjbR/CyaY-like superfamily)